MAENRQPMAFRICPINVDKSETVVYNTSHNYRRPVVFIFNDIMLKKILVSAVLSVAALTAPVSVSADDQVCVSVYGGGVVCGAQAPHKPVEAGLAENIALLGGGSMLASGVFYFLSKKASIR